MSRIDLAANFASWVTGATLKEMSTLCLLLANELLNRAEPGASHLAAAARALDARIAQHNVM